MTPLGWFMVVICSIVGVSIGFFLSKHLNNLAKYYSKYLVKYFPFKHFPNLFTFDKKMQRVLQDPHLLVEKLRSQGKLYDGGKELDIKVGVDSKTGKEVVVIEEKASKKAKDVQKKVEKAQVQEEKNTKTKASGSLKKKPKKKTTRKQKKAMRKK